MFGESDDLVVEIPKDDLLADLERNRANHRQVFEQAVERYHAKLRQLLTEHHSQVLTDPPQPVRVRLDLPVPEDHTDDYDRVIAMVKRHRGDTIRVSEGKWANYVDDVWGWTRAWRGSTASYVNGN